MGQKTNTQSTKMNINEDYIYSSYEVAIVTDTNDNDFPVPEDEMIPDNMPMNPNTHVIVWYYGQKYWIPKNFHFPQ